MLYHSPLKHFIKGLLGRKNDAWYFDRMVSAYDKRMQKEFGRIQQLVETDTDSTLNGGIENPAFEPWWDKTRQLIEHYKDSSAGASKVIVLHQPPASFAPAFASWYQNIGQALQHLGHSIIYSWKLEDVDWQQVDFFFTSFHAQYLELVPWQLLPSHCRVICYCNPFLTSVQEVETHLSIFRTHRIDAAFTFCAESFAKESLTAKGLKMMGKPILSVPFSVNPALHVPPSRLCTEWDYVFLGSTNWDKARRYADYFTNIVASYRGVLYGQGWPWALKSDINFGRDKRFYARSAVALNLHISLQMQADNEVNERTYLLAGTGMPQLCDSPPALQTQFESRIRHSDSPAAYFQQFAWMLSNLSEARKEAVNTMLYTLDKHNSYLRAFELTKKLQSFR